MFQSYDAAVFNRLPSFQQARVLGDANRERLGNLGAILARHGKTGELGINRLHNHFPLDEGRNERLVKTWGTDGASLRPMAADEAKEATLVPYLWQVRREGGKLTWCPLEFVREDEANRATVQRLGSAEAFLTEMGEALEESGLSGIYGVCTLARPIEVAEGMSLVERTDEARRVLTLTPEPLATLDPAEAVETNWRFDSTGRRTTLVCISHCYHAREEIICVSHCYHG